MTFWENERCIDCGTCWQWDPQHFAPAPSGDAAHVWRQPEGEPETTRALLALRACPVAAIQAPADQVRRTPADGFPALLTHHPAGEVYYCGLDVRWLLPGHGGKHRFEPGEWASQIDGLLRSWGPSAAAAAPVADAAALPCVASD
jgi:ferredoxin